MTATEYDLEDIPQDLIARYPELLGGGQITPDDPRRWILIQREAGIPREEGGGSHWHLDHLFLDQDGIPTLVEVKRSANREIRRMVVGQLLDYAANAVRYWPIGEVIERFEATCAERGAEQAAVLSEVIGEDENPDDFWSRVDNNLRSGRLRLMVVADEIPSELQAIIEFLNGQMDRTEVLGVEIRQYVGEDRQTLVPRVIGLTAAAKTAKSTGDPRSYEERLEDSSETVVRLDAMIQELAASEGMETTTSKTARQLRVSWGTAFQLYAPAGRVEFCIQPLRNAGLDEEANRLLAQLQELAGHDMTDAYPNVDATALVEHWDRFLSEFLPKYLEISGKARARGQSPV
jgi:hypothetical protein